MKLVRFASDGSKACVGIVLDGEVVDLGIGDPIRLIQQIESSKLSEEEFISTEYNLTRLRRIKFTELDNVHPEKPHLLKPIVPAEVWGFGVTYIRSRAARETERLRRVSTIAFTRRNDRRFSSRPATIDV